MKEVKNMTIGIFKNGHADWFYECADIEITDSFIRFKKNNNKDMICFFFCNIEGYAIREEVQQMEIIIAFGCGCAFIIPPLIAASVSDAVQRKRKRNEILKNFGIKP